MTVADRPRTALLVIDVQKGVMAEAHDRDTVIGNIATLVDRARQGGTPVVWVQHSDEGLQFGSEPWAYVDELTPADGEPLVHKKFGDSFEDTTLESVLAEAEVGSLIVTGAQTDACIRATLHGGFVRGYDVTLVADAHTTEDLTEWGAPTPGDVIAHTNLYWTFQGAPGRRGKVMPTAEVAF